MWQYGNSLLANYYQIFGIAVTVTVVTNHHSGHAVLLVSNFDLLFFFSDPTMHMQRAMYFLFGLD